ncbi:hypothetical protein T03_9098, partial [Trichinella britovi]
LARQSGTVIQFEKAPDHFIYSVCGSFLLCRTKNRPQFFTLCVDPFCTAARRTTLSSSPCVDPFCCAARRTTLSSSPW